MKEIRKKNKVNDLESALEVKSTSSRGPLVLALLWNWEVSTFYVFSLHPEINILEQGPHGSALLGAILPLSLTTYSYLSPNNHQNIIVSVREI